MKAETWIDDEGRLTRGDYRGRHAEDVAQERPGYVAWIVRDTKCCDEDAEILRTHLQRAGHRIDPWEDHAREQEFAHACFNVERG